MSPGRSHLVVEYYRHDKTHRILRRSVVPTKMINDLLQVCLKGSFEKQEFAVMSMVNEGYAATQILSQLHDCIIEQDLSDEHKSVITEKMAVVDKCLSDGADEYLQLLSLCSAIVPQAPQNN